MCGIFGKLYFSPHPDEKQRLLDCLETLRHRGPDSIGHYTDRRVFLGSTRLSIIDLSPDGSMPMSNADGSLLIVFNGEIYNYRELRRDLLKKYRFRSASDTEVVLHLYEEYGPACLGMLRGMFAFAIWNTRNKELFIARDQLGKKPLKFYRNDRFFMFASELKALLKDPAVPRQIDHVAIDQFLTLQYVPSPRTGFLNIFKLEPAHYLRITSNGTMTKRRYWEPPSRPNLKLPEYELKDSIIKKLKESVRLRLRSDVPLGSHLSGGIDSSLVTAFAAEELNKPLKTFSVGFADSDYNELPYARLVAERYRTNHHEILVGPEIIRELPQMMYYYEEPFADPSALPTWELCRQTRKEVTVALNGDGGDENFAGYQRYPAFMLARHLRHVPFLGPLSNILTGTGRITSVKPILQAGKLLRYAYRYDSDERLYAKLLGGMDSDERNLFYTKEFRRKISRENAYAMGGNMRDPFRATMLQRVLATDLQAYLSDDLLVKIDIGGMAHSVEIRAPFLDQEFVELAASVPDHYKLRGLTGKYILREIARKYLPDACIDRKKHGFEIPLKRWMDSSWGEEKRALSEAKLYTYGILDRNHVRRTIDSPRADHKQLWALLILKTWLYTWFP